MTTTPSTTKLKFSTPRSACARIRNILKAAGLPLAKKSGRYAPYGSTLVVTEGYSVHKVGVSRSVAISYDSSHVHGRSFDLPRDVLRAKREAAIELLRSLGYEVSDVGWVDCEDKDLSDI